MWWSVSRARQETWIRSLQPPRRWSPGISVWRMGAGRGWVRPVTRGHATLSWACVPCDIVIYSCLFCVKNSSSGSLLCKLWFIMILYSQTHWRINRMSSSWLINKHWILFAEIMNHDLSGCNGDLRESAAVPAPQSSHCAVPHWDK